VRPSVFPILDGSFYSLIIFSSFLKVSKGRSGFPIVDEVPFDVANFKGESNYFELKSEGGNSWSSLS